MRFLANENFPGPAIKVLRNAGYKVISIQEEYSGISDDAVVSIAQKENLIILTFDSDYGEIVFKHAQENPPSVVFFRFKGRSPNYAGVVLLQLLQDSIILDGFFTVVEADGVRQRKF